MHHKFPHTSVYGGMGLHLSVSCASSDVQNFVLRPMEKRKEPCTVNIRVQVQNFSLKNLVFWYQIYDISLWNDQLNK